jgi:spoIIIJ-associated protein
MADTTEATGRTLEDAKKAAAEALGLSVDQCEFTVLEESSKGLFAKTNFRVRATAASSSEPAKPAKPEKPEKPAKVEKPRAVRGSRAAVDLPAPADEAAESAGPGETVEATKKDGEAAVDLVNEMMKAGDFAAKAKVESLTGKYVNLQLTGEDVGVLIGQSGEGLDSLQYLANAMLGRILPQGVRLTLDAADHRAKREAALMKLAQDVAAAVMERKQEAVLDALPAHERRIIHKALQEIEGVETYSEGEEPARRVVVTPKK